jgi:histidine triad (HIT) family protein
MDCIFCEIIDKKGDLISENENAAAFNDLNPMAPIHILIVPKKHYKNITEIPANVLKDMISLSKKLIDEKSNGEFRLIFNTGSSAGQSVFHAHGHIISGQQLEWNPA